MKIPDEKEDLQVAMNPMESFEIEHSLHLEEEIKKDDVAPPPVEKVIALSTINNRYPAENWLHIYTDGSLQDKWIRARSEEMKWQPLVKNPDMIPNLPRKAAVAHFRLLTGHDSNLKRHCKLHDGNKFICAVCDRSFAAREMIQSHLRTHDEQRETRSCKLCNVVVMKSSYELHCKTLKHRQILKESRRTSKKKIAVSRET
ncbi:hypothetical protein WDU94_003728 [Cyamophila willieti]